LWIGALERIAKAGITEIAAIHRGFSWFEKTPFRNDPKWEFPIELKRLFPDLEIICDPSHIAGNRELLEMVAQKALDLNFSGLMIESHHTPDEAWSDAQQQITPAALENLLGRLKFRKSTSDDAMFLDKLAHLRAEIDDLDTELLQKLAARMKIVEEIGEYKRDNNVTIYQVERWKEILRTRGETGKLLGLNDRFVKAFIQAMHKESIARQTDIMNESIENKKGQ
jgi:chorismate mutase